MAEQQQSALDQLARNCGELCRRTWWVFLIGGIASIVFGVLAFANPGIALLVLGMFFAAYLLVDGAVNIWGAISNRDKDGWWIILLLGILSAGLGAWLLLWPPASMLALVYVVAFMALFVGVSLLSLGWRIRKEVKNEWVLYFTGALSLLIGAFIVLFPAAGGLYVVYMIAGWAIIVGALRVWIAFRVRNLPARVRDRMGSATT